MERIIDTAGKIDKKVSKKVVLAVIAIGIVGLGFYLGQVPYEEFFDKAYYAVLTLLGAIGATDVAFIAKGFKKPRGWSGGDPTEIDVMHDALDILKKSGKVDPDSAAIKLIEGFLPKKEA